MSEERELIDGLFYIEETRWKTWRSASKDGEELITALHRDLCIEHTRFYLKGRQEGWGSMSCSTYEGEVGGKL
jgi:hypothetical protein